MKRYILGVIKRNIDSRKRGRVEDPILSNKIYRKEAARAI
jgi:hypothetical protein